MNLSEIRKDVILFKDETLRMVREIGKQLFEGIKEKSIEMDSKIGEIESKLSKYRDTNKRMLEIILEQKLYIEKIKNLSEFKSKTESRLLSFDIKLNNFFSELVNFKSRFDKIIIDNLTIPGIVGTSCKFNTIADYIVDNINKYKLMHAEQEIMKNDVHFLKKYSENLEKSLNGVVDVSVNTSKLYSDARNKELKNFFTKVIDNLNNILEGTKDNIEKNVYKKDDVKLLIKSEIKISHKEIKNIIEDQKKVKEKNNKERDNKERLKSDRYINANELKKELKEIKNDFKELKANMENKITNVFKTIKSQEISKSNNVNNNILLKSDNIKNKDNRDSKDKSIYLDKEKSNETQEYNKTNIKNKNNNNNKNNNTETYYKTIQNNDTDYYNNIVKENKEINNEYNKTEEIITRCKSNSKTKSTPKHYKIKSIEKALGLKSSKQNNKFKEGFLNPLYLNTYETERDIVNMKSILRNENNSQNKEKLIQEYKQNPRNDYKYHTFSATKNNFYRKYYQEGNNNLINNEEKKIKNKIYLNNKKEPEKGKKEKKKYAIHLINSNNLKDLKSPLNKNMNNYNENDYSNDEKNYFDFNIKEENKDNDINKNNIAIKLMKNKKQMVDEYNLNYIKQCYPTLNLYKNYYNKKIIENKEKEKLKEKAKTPQKILPAFCRTAYIEFIKPNNNINLKRHNGNANIVINNKNFKNLIQDKKYFYTLNLESKRNKSFTKDKNKKKQKNEENEENLSV